MATPPQPSGGQKGPGTAKAATVAAGGDAHAQTQVGTTGSAATGSTGADAEAGKKATQLGDFVLKKKLGQGGMGAVYLGHQVSLDRACAVKVMAKELAAKPGFVERFLREARAMARIDHPHVVSCYAVGEDKGHHYVAMELIEGQSLQDWLDQLGKIPVADAVLVGIVAGDALQYAHSLKMIHRDIKPDNILVTSKGVIKVADLGLAKATDEDMSMTQSGTGLGTPHYMPPEQARNAKHVDHRCDVYALGCTLYHLVTGQLPFSGETIVDLITAKEQGKFKPARRINPDVPERLDLMIDKAMMKDAAHRYQSMQEFVSDLESLQLAGDSLSFIAHPQKAVLRRGGSASSAPATASGRPGAKLPPAAPATSAQDAARQARVDDPQKVWFIKGPDETGRIKVSKMTTVQVLAGLKADKIGPKAQASQQAQGQFVPLAQIPAFEDETRKMLTRTRAANRDQGLAAAYQQIEKEYNRLKWWRLLARFRDGTLGIVGLIVYLTVIVAVIGGLVWVVPHAWEWAATQFNLK